VEVAEHFEEAGRKDGVENLRSTEHWPAAESRQPLSDSISHM
jgi:hypothetical protein